MAQRKKKTEEETKPLPSANLDSISDSLAESSPEVSQSFVDQAQDAKQEKESEWAHLRDKQGYTFDSKIHLSKDDGSPKLNKDGTIQRRRLRKKKSQTDGEQISDAVTVQLTAEQQTQARYAGVAAASSLFVVCRGLGGEEWIPQKDETQGIDERAELQTAFGDYFVSKGWTEFPPGIALSLCLGMYAAPRFTLPQTQSRIKSAWTKSREWLGRRKKSATRVDSRNDRQREIDAGKDTGKERTPEGKKGNSPRPHV